MPKIMASLFVIPMLIIISAGLSIWGGRIVGGLFGIISFDIYDSGLRQKFKPYNAYVALSKAYTFSFILSSIPAYYGFNVKGGALEIGRSSTKAVMVSCIIILIADYILAAILL